MQSVESTTKTYVTFWYPGSFVSEDETQQVETRIVEGIKIPRGCYAFQYFDLATTEIEIDGVKKKVAGDKKELSPLYYPGGKVYSVAEVRRLAGDHRNLISNMECNGWDHVVKSRRGNFRPYKEGKDAILDNFTVAE